MANDTLAGVQIVSVIVSDINIILGLYSVYRWFTFYPALRSVLLTICGLTDPKMRGPVVNWLEWLDYCLRPWA